MGECVLVYCCVDGVSVCRCCDLYRQTWQCIPIYCGHELWSETGTFILYREEQVILLGNKDVAMRLAL